MLIGFFSSIRSYLLLCLFLCVIIFLSTAFDKLYSNEIEGIVLEVQKNEKDSNILMFCLSNNSDKDFVTTPIRTNYNRIVVIKPDGGEKEEFSWKKGIKEIVIRPKEKKCWEVDLHTFFVADFNEIGVYQIYWKIADLKSTKIVIQKEHDELNNL